MEFSNPWTEVFTIGNRLQHTRHFTLTACLDDAVAPPVKLDLGKLEEKENKNGCNGNGAAERRREDKVVFGPKAEIMPFEIDPRIPTYWYSWPNVGYVVRTPLCKLAFDSCHVPKIAL